MKKSTRDYKKLYALQDVVFSMLEGVSHPFYLTGGTTLARFYFDHRYSEDLDFFVNGYPKEQFAQEVQKIETLLADKNTAFSEVQKWESYTRLVIEGNGEKLKIEFVNDVPHRVGVPHIAPFGQIDTVANILSNKITCIVSRDEPKDIVDLVTIAKHCSFSWLELFYEAKKKQIINELDVARRIDEFPLSWLDRVDWLDGDFDKEIFAKELKALSDDFFLAKPNSLGAGKVSVYQIKPKENK